MSAADSPRTALVTGGAGFIGGHIVDRLVGDGWDVRVLDDLSSGKEENLSASRDRIQLIRGDLRDERTVADAVAGVEVVFHQAAVPSVPLWPCSTPYRTSRQPAGRSRSFHSAPRRGPRTPGRT